jgi:hypothetical protein
MVKMNEANQLGANNLYECKHCAGTGTCTSSNGNSCGKCIQDAKSHIPFSSKNKEIGSVGLVCSVCDGLGVAQTKTDKINSRAQFRLALWIVLPVLFVALIMVINGSRYFSQYLTFASTLIASITGFYFANRKDKSK